MRTTVDARGRIVIPRATREQARLRAGSPVEVRYCDGNIEIVPTPLAAEFVRRGDLVVAMASVPQTPLTQADVDGVLGGVRNDRLEGFS